MADPFYIENNFIFMAMYEPNSDIELAFLPLGFLTRESHQFLNTIVTHPTDKGKDVCDLIAPLPKKISLRGFFHENYFDIFYKIQPVVVYSMLELFHKSANPVSVASSIWFFKRYGLVSFTYETSRTGAVLINWSMELQEITFAKLEQVAITDLNSNFDAINESNAQQLSGLNADLEKLLNLAQKAKV